MSVAPNLCCDETKNRGTYTRMTFMVPLLGFNLSETTSARKRPSTAGAQLREAPTLAEGQETQCRGRPIVLETWAVKNELSRKLTWPCLRFQKTSGLGKRSSHLWLEGPLQSIISCFLEPPANRWAAGGTIEGLWRGYSSACPKGAICWVTVAVTQAGGGSSVLPFLCAKY